MLIAQSLWFKGWPALPAPSVLLAVLILEFSEIPFLPLEKMLVGQDQMGWFSLFRSKSFWGPGTYGMSETT
jgi:hypothetical protein